MKGDSGKKKGYFLYGVDSVLLALSAEYTNEEREKSIKKVKVLKRSGCSLASSSSKKK